MARELGEEEDWLFEIASGMEPEDALIWVYGADDEGVMAFSDFGAENLQSLITEHRSFDK